VASNTQPLKEAIEHKVTGRLFEFFDTAALTQQVCELLDSPEERANLGAKARRFAQTHYDLNTVCLPQQVAWLESMA
jgi:glycosyltransferase involved in cell wall biosynthesis